VTVDGFLGVGTPHRLVDALIGRGARGLTIIGNDTARPGLGIRNAELRVPASVSVMPLEAESAAVKASELAG
jgi:acyl CoA:acetate/3-ketoacid CoA transferase alpha subunit